MNGHKLIRRKRPWSGRPDRYRGLRGNFRRNTEYALDLGRILDWKGYIDSPRLSVLIFDLSLCEGTFTVGTPVNGFRALMKMTIIDDPTQ